MLWIKTFHILFVMAWMAGLFYMPRIFVHYVEGRQADEDVRRLSTMAFKLFRFSTLMGTIALTLGLWLWLGYGFQGNWLMVKLGLVVLLMLYHYQCFRYVVQMQDGQLIRSSVYFRFFNESALLIAIPILIMVVVKPNI